MTVPALPRCADAARVRADPAYATAPPAARLFLVEVPGPWGRTALTDSRLDRYTSGRLADSADVADVRVLLVRRPGRHAHRRGRRRGGHDRGAVSQGAGLISQAEGLIFVARVSNP